MSKKKLFEHEIAPELLAEIEEWEQRGFRYGSGLEK